MSKDIIQKSIDCLAKAKLETTYAVARDIVLDELMNLQKIEKEHQKLNGELRKENQNLKERCEYLQRSCERKEEQMLDYRQEYMEQENYKSRIDKAIEYAKTHIIEDSEYENYMQCEREEKEELLNILQDKGE